MVSKKRKGTPDSTGESGASRKTASESLEPIDKAALVNRLLHSIEERLNKEEAKGTLGDLIRLLQLQRELEEEQPGEVEVRWVEPEPANANGE